jgi:hypothetical protein
VALQKSDGFRREDISGDRILAEVSGEQVSGKFRDIVEPFPKRRQVDFEGVDAKEQVFSKTAVLNHLLEFTIRRTDDADIHVKRLVVAHTTNFAGLKEPQEFYLHGFVEFSEFVKEQSSAIGHLEQPGSIGICSREGSPTMSEEFAFHQIFRNWRRS